MKKLISVLLCSLTMFLLMGCGDKTTSTATDKTKEQYADKDFMNSLSKGLEARWDLNDKDDQSQKSSGKQIQNGSEEQRKAFISYADAELSEIDKYKNEKFEDSKLQEKAIKYINLINDQKASCDYITADYKKFGQIYSKSYNERSQLLIDFVNNYGLTASEKHSQILKDLVIKGQEVTKVEDSKNAVKTMTDAIKFEKVDSSSSWKKYQAVVENTSGIDFSYYDLSINLLDKDGVIVETEHANVANWGKGQKAKFEFSSNKEFTSTSIVADYNTK